jgi:hypothetical protein
MYQQLWGYKVEEKLYLGVREQKRLNTKPACSVEVKDKQELYSSQPWRLHGGNGICFTLFIR